jgi:hypothetical protein
MMAGMSVMAVGGFWAYDELFSQIMYVSFSNPAGRVTKEITKAFCSHAHSPTYVYSRSILNVIA